MFFNDRESTRQFFFAVWERSKSKKMLASLETLVLDVILAHPEYHQLLEKKGEFIERAGSSERRASNPFLHMGLHIALQEQIQADRPAGIRRVYQDLCDKSIHNHDIEHKMMAVLGEMLWQAQRDNKLPDETAYLEKIKRLK